MSEPPGPALLVYEQVVAEVGDPALMSASIDQIIADHGRAHHRVVARPEAYGKRHRRRAVHDAGDRR